MSLLGWLALVVVATGLQASVDFFTRRADRKLLRVAAWDPHFSAQGFYGLSGQC